MKTADKRRFAILAASYAALVVIAFMAWIAVHVYVGALSVIPLLFISYYLRPTASLGTAFATGAVITLLDKAIIPHGNWLTLPPLLDGFILTAALCAAVVIARRLREINVANEILRGSLIKARRAAEHDPLTGIVNRAYFRHALGEAAERANATQRVAVLFCDLDGFKAINDTHGHRAGDIVLRMAAARLANTVRAVDVVARLGGDEFGVLVRHVHDAGEAAHMALNIEHAFRDPFQSEDQRYRIGITVGISICPEDGTDPDTLLHIADARMYRSKRLKHIARIPI